MRPAKAHTTRSLCLLLSLLLLLLPSCMDGQTALPGETVPGSESQGATSPVTLPQGIEPEGGDEWMKYRSPGRTFLAHPLPAPMGSLEDPDLSYSLDCGFRFESELVACTAQVMEATDDVYRLYTPQFSDDSKWTLYCVMTLSSPEGQEVPEFFYLLQPKEARTKLKSGLTYLLHDMKQYAPNGMILYNETKGGAEQFNVPLYYIPDGKSDYTKMPTVKGYEKDDPAIADDLARVAGIYRKNDLSANAARPGIIPIPDGSDPEYALAFKTFMQSGDAYLVSPGWEDLGAKVFPEWYPASDLVFRRYIGGFPTTEAFVLSSNIYIHHDTDATRQKDSHIFTAADIALLPDAQSARETIHEKYLSGKLLPLHEGEFEGCTFEGYNVFAWYTKLNDTPAAIVRLSFSHVSSEASYNAYMDHLYFAFTADGMTEVTAEQIEEQSGTDLFLLGRLGMYTVE